MITIICESCHSKKEIWPYEVRQGRKFCSNKCRYISQLGKPTYFTQTMKKGVSFNTGRTRFKKGLVPWNKGKKGFLSGSDHWNWMGDKPSYRAVHEWIRKELGTPSKCEHCGTLDSKRFEWANISKEYRRDITDWKRLCKSCHNKYDQTGQKAWITRREGASL